MKLLESFYKKDVRALSKIISAIENNQNGVQDILGELFPKAAKAVRIGITGPPGAGKSTLVNGLTHEFLKNQKKVGILAYINEHQNLFFLNIIILKPKR